MLPRRLRTGPREAKIIEKTYGFLVFSLICQHSAYCGGSVSLGDPNLPKSVQTSAHGPPGVRWQSPPGWVLGDHGLSFSPLDGSKTLQMAPVGLR